MFFASKLDKKQVIDDSEVKTMGKTMIKLRQPPQFSTTDDGKPTEVTLSTVGYITLLIRANVIDLALWPPWMKEGAAALARIRQIEADCIAQHGEFDWEKLSEAVQDEYDGLCALLDRLQDTGERIPFEVYKARRKENQP